MATRRYRKDRRRWEVDYRRRGERFKRHFKNKKNADEFRRQIEELIERENSGLGAIEPILFKDFCELFLENHFIEKSPKYKRTVFYQLKSCLIPRFGDLEMTNITFEDVVAFKADRETQSVSAKTVREDLALLQLVFKAAIKNHYALDNPVADVELPRATPTKIRTAVPDERLRQDLRKMEGREMMMVLLLRNTGLRFGELFRLTHEDIDHENRVISIKSVKGGTTKNYHSRETILTPTAAKILRLIPTREGPLFSIQQRSAETNFYLLKRAMGFDWSLHSLRHSFVTKLRMANIPERIVACYVGHNQRSETDRYTSYTKEFIEASIAAADFGSEFLEEPTSVVPIWSPQKSAKLEASGIEGEMLLPNVPRAGLEPAQVAPHDP